jgi:hypothetical protein
VSAERALTAAEARSAARRAPRGLAGDISALAEALEGVELADRVVEVRLGCSSEAELDSVAGSLGAEVQTRSGIRVARRKFGAVRVVAYARQSPAS